jgi:hypothetical protein
MHDEMLGLIYNRARMLRFGRFMQRDPLGYVDGMSVYLSYLLNPIGAVDPYGLTSAPCRVNLLSWPITDIAWCAETAKGSKDKGELFCFTEAFESEDIAEEVMEAAAKQLLRQLLNRALTKRVMRRFGNLLPTKETLETQVVSIGMYALVDLEYETCGRPAWDWEDRSRNDVVYTIAKTAIDPESTQTVGIQDEIFWSRVENAVNRILPRASEAIPTLKHDIGVWAGLEVEDITGCKNIDPMAGY